MQRQLASIVGQLESAQRRLHELVDGTPNERWSTRADPARWSVAECVVHLNLTSRAYIPLLRNALADPRLTGMRGPPFYRRDALGWLLSVTTGPLPRIGRYRFGRLKTTSAFVPGGDMERGHIVRDFDDFQAQLIELTRAADGKPLELMRIVSPFDARVSYNAYSCLVILPRHQERHLWQAQHVWHGR